MSSTKKGGSGRGAGPSALRPRELAAAQSKWEDWLQRLDPAWARAYRLLRDGQEVGELLVATAQQAAPHALALRPADFASEDLPVLQRLEVAQQRLTQIHLMLKARQQRFEAGNTLEILFAVNTCAVHGLPLPAWVAEAFAAQFGRFTKVDGDSDSLDEVFSSRHIPAGSTKRHARTRQNWQLGAELWRAVRAVAKDHGGLDGALSAVLDAKSWGVGKTRARELVDMIDRSQAELAGTQPLSRLWVKPRKQ